MNTFIIYKNIIFWSIYLNLTFYLILATFIINKIFTKTLNINFNNYKLCLIIICIYLIYKKIKDI
jgi:hypothetical protein